MKTELARKRKERARNKAREKGRESSFSMSLTGGCSPVGAVLGGGW